MSEATGRGQAFGEKDRHHCEPRCGVCSQEPEDRSPPEVHEQLATDERSQDRRQPHDEHQHRQHADRTRLIEVIAHDRPRDHDRRAAAERLKKAERDQRVDALGSRTSDRRDHEERQSEIQDRLAAQPIRERPVEGLTDRDADEVCGQAGLDNARSGPELARDGRQRRQIHVDCQRTDRRQRAQNEREAIVVNVRVRFADGLAMHPIRPACSFVDSARSGRPSSRSGRCRR